MERGQASITLTLMRLCCVPRALTVIVRRPRPAGWLALRPIYCISTNYSKRQNTFLTTICWLFQGDFLMVMTLALEHCWRKIWSYMGASNYNNLLTKGASCWVFVMAFRCLYALGCYQGIGVYHPMSLRYQLQALPITLQHSLSAVGSPY